MDTLCWCNECYSRRFSLGKDSRQKYDDCKAQQALDYAYAANEPKTDVASDAIVEANRQLLLDRSNVGIAKYGVTLEASNLSRPELIQHALEEALDLANYLQALLMLKRKDHG